MKEKLTSNAINQCHLEIQKYTFRSTLANLIKEISMKCVTLL
jgi:hypothetical protein